MRKGRVKDASPKSSVVAGLHERTHLAELQDQELAGLQQSAEAAHHPDDLVRPGHRLGAATTGKRGRQPQYSDAAIQTCLTMKVLFGMALRQTTGFVESLLRLVGLDWAVPDFSTLSRRQKTLAVCIPYRGSQGPLNLLIDSTGIKAEGEGEWHARKHGGAKRRLWRKIHIGVDEQTLEIRAVEITGSNVGDAPTLPELLDQIPADVRRLGHRRRSLRHAQVPRRRRRSRRPCRHTATQERQAMETIDCGRHRPRTRLFAHRSTSVARFGESGADTTAEVAPRRRCTA